ncbi:YaeQ family protein [Frateuria aurantia]
MAVNATIYKAELQINDMDRHYYATHALTLAQHPSETEARLMARLLAFALYADDRLEFGKGLSDENEPALLRRSYSQDIELWIDLGQPDEARLRKACGRSEQVVVINYAGHAGDVWWDKAAAGLRRFENLTVLEIPEEAIAGMTAIVERSSRWQCLIQDGELQLINEDAVIVAAPHVRMGRYLAEA